MLYKSIRFRLVLWYMLILSLTLTVLGVTLYHNFSHKFKRDMDNLLQSRAKGISDSIDTYWEAERLRSGKTSNTSNVKDFANFAKIAQRWVDEKTLDPTLISFSVHIFDAYGRPVAFSKSFPAPTFSEKMFDDIFVGRSRFDDWKIDLTPGKPTVFRTYTTPVIENNKIAYVVQVASPIGQMRSALHNLALLLLTLLPLTVGLTGMAGAFLAKVALDPVHKMIATTRQISAENLKLRIASPHSRDEINALAVTFNEMLERLDESFTSQQQFMQDISHELKTPLSVLKGELEVTLKKARSATEYETTLVSSLEEVNSLVKIVENLLTLARFDTKTVNLEPEPLNLNELIPSVVDDIQVLAEQKAIAIRVEGPAPIQLRADRNQIKRLLLNLLDNAIKYTGPHGSITVKTLREQGFVKIAVSDTGRGIPSDELAHIFDRFYQVDKSRGGKGFGLGLSIAKSIVEAHKGRIDVQTRLDQGSTFTVSFPT